MKLYKEGKIEFDDEVPSSNLSSVTTMSPQPNALIKAIRFGSFELVILALSVEKVKSLKKVEGMIALIQLQMMMMKSGPWSLTEDVGKEILPILQKCQKDPRW